MELLGARASRHAFSAIVAGLSSSCVTSYLPTFSRTRWPVYPSFAASAVCHGFAVSCRRGRCGHFPPPILFYRESAYRENKMKVQNDSVATSRLSSAAIFNQSTRCTPVGRA